MAELFLSYARQDSQLVDHFRQALVERGYDIWMDRESITTSDPWWPAIEQGIANCQAVIAVLSLRSVGSEFVERELSYAKNKQKPVIPVAIEPAGTAWGRFEEVQCIDLMALPFPAAIEKLTQALLRFGVYLSEAPQTQPAAPRVSLLEVIQGTWNAGMQDSNGAWRLQITIGVFNQFQAFVFRSPSPDPYPFSGSWRVAPPSELILDGKWNAIWNPFQTQPWRVSFLFTKVSRDLLDGFTPPERLPCVWRRVSY